jgi:hypothetical protein
MVVDGGAVLLAEGVPGVVYGALSRGLWRVSAAVGAKLDKVADGVDSIWDRLKSDQTGAIGPDRPDLQLVHGDELIKEGASYDYWREKSTDAIVRSLEPGIHEGLIVNDYGLVYNGNTRIGILIERGVDVNLLPRELY